MLPNQRKFNCKYITHHFHGSTSVPVVVKPDLSPVIPINSFGEAVLQHYLISGVSPIQTL